MIETTTENTSSGNSGLKNYAMFVFDFLKVIIIALAIILPIRYFVFQPFIVSGSSMEPNFSDGQYLIIDELTYHFRGPTRGEVVVLKSPGIVENDSKEFYIKRVVGLPGEKVKIDNGRVTIFNNEYPDGLEVNESYLPSQGLTFPHNTSVVGGMRLLELKSDEYFMLGDNRLASSDSRDWGVLPRDEMIGRAFVRVLPLPTFTKFKTPEYNFN